MRRKMGLTRRRRDMCFVDARPSRPFIMRHRNLSRGVLKPRHLLSACRRLEMFRLRSRRVRWPTFNPRHASGLACLARTYRRVRVPPAIGRHCRRRLIAECILSAPRRGSRGQGNRFRNRRCT